jgi:hypothetical protein
MDDEKGRSERKSGERVYEGEGWVKVCMHGIQRGGWFQETWSKQGGLEKKKQGEGRRETVVWECVAVRD